MTILNEITHPQTQQNVDTISTAVFVKTVGTMFLIAGIICLTMWGLASHAQTTQNHAAVKDYVRTDVLMLNTNLDRGDAITYFSGTETLHGTNQTLRTTTTIDPIDKTHYITHRRLHGHIRLLAR